VRRDLHLLAAGPAMLEALHTLGQGYARLGPAAQSRLRQTYVAANPQPLGERDRLVEGAGPEAYHRAHARFHPWLREWARTRAWGDLLLVDLRGNVVDSTHKQGDFATNLLTGPWRDTGLARVVKPLLDQPVAGVASFAGFAFYAPNEYRPASFLALPLFDGFSVESPHPPWSGVGKGVVW